MKRTLKRCFVGIVLAVLLGASCLLAACGDNETPPGTETAFTIEGVVSSDMGPLSGVAVTLGEESKTTGTAGSYSFEVAEGEYTLTFAKDGYVTQTKTVNTDDAVSGTVTLNVSMAAAQKEYVVISGKVTDAESGAALEGAVISGSALESSVTTDTDGAYTLPQLEKGSYSFTVSMNGYTSQTVSVSESDITGTAYTLNIQLTAIPAEELVTVSGTVTADYPRGALSGVTVSAGAGYASATTDENGAYSLSLTSGDYTLTFSKEGYDEKTQSVTASDFTDDTYTLDVSLVLSQVLAGKTNAELAAEVAELTQLPVLASSGSTAIEDIWKIGGDGHAHKRLTEGYQIDSQSGNESEDGFTCYFYGKTTVTDATDTLLFFGRTFRSTETEVSVKVIDAKTLDSAFLEELNSESVWTACNTDDYQRFEYDLSTYNGETVIIAVGVRKAALTVESIFFTADTFDATDTFVFGRTTDGALDDLKKVPITSGTEYKATGEPLIQDAFVTVGAATVDNNRWMLVDARGGEGADAQPYSYVYLKTDITEANARMTVHWSNYNNAGSDNKGLATTKVLAVDTTTNEVIKLYSGNTATDGEWITATFDLAECVGKEIILAVGMSYGNRMGIDYIRFDRMSYTLTGTVTLPSGDYSLDKVSFTLNDNLLTSGENGFTFDTQTGEYSLTLDASVTEGTLEVSYDNTGIADPTQQLVEAAFSLSDIDDYGNAAWSPKLSQNSDAAQTIYVTISIESTEELLTDAQADEAVVKLGSDYTFKYDAENDVWKLEGLTMAQAMAAGDLTVTFIDDGSLVNIYEAVNNGPLSSSNYADGQADISVSLVERDILPGLTFSEMKKATVLSYDYYQGYRAHNVFCNFAKSEGIRSQEQDQGDTIQTETTRATSETEFNGYIYARKTITDGNKTMIISMRTHNTSIETKFGVMVVDLTTGARELVGGILSSTSNSYTDRVFDLSAYVGKEVLVSTGIFYTQACDDALPENEQLQYVIHHIRFCELGSDWGNTVDTLAGNLLKNTDVAGQSINDFVGSANDKDKSNYIFSKWGTASKNFASADYEMKAPEGALIKTRDDERNVENCVFLYSKFAIAEQNSYLRFKARGFGGGKIPELAVTVYSLGAGGEVVEQIITPDISAFDLNGNQVKDMGGGWINGTWDTDNYTQFEWNLSGFKGENVVIMIGLRNTLGGENKIAIQEIHLGSAADGQSAGKVTA